MTVAVVWLLSNAIIVIGLVRSSSDHPNFQITDVGCIKLVVYVDDTLITSSDEQIHNLKDFLQINSEQKKYMI